MRLGRKFAKAATLRMLIPAIPVFDKPWPNAAKASAAHTQGERCITVILLAFEDSYHICELVRIERAIAIRIECPNEPLSNYP